MLLYIPYLFSCAALLLTVYIAFRKENQEDKKALLLRLGKVETEQANQIARQTGFQTEIENVADYGKRERVAMIENSRQERLALIENARREHEVLKDMIKDVPVMRDLLSRMDERFLSTKEEMKNLSGKMDKILDVLTKK